MDKNTKIPASRGAERKFKAYFGQRPLTKDKVLERCIRKKEVENLTRHLDEGASPCLTHLE